MPELGSRSDKVNNAGVIMRYLICFLFLNLFFCAPISGGIEQISFVQAASRPSGQDHSSSHLKQARYYQEQGRYELARQSYALALSTCQDPGQLEIIKREMNNVELILRSLR